LVPQSIAASHSDRDARYQVVPLDFDQFGGSVSIMASVKGVMTVFIADDSYQPVIEKESSHSDLLDKWQNVKTIPCRIVRNINKNTNEVHQVTGCDLAPGSANLYIHFAESRNDIGQLSGPYQISIIRSVVARRLSTPNYLVEGPFVSQLHEDGVVVSVTTNQADLLAEVVAFRKFGSVGLPLNHVDVQARLLLADTGAACLKKDVSIDTANTEHFITLTGCQFSSQESYTVAVRLYTDADSADYVLTHTFPDVPALVYSEASSAACQSNQDSWWFVDLKQEKRVHNIKILTDEAADAGMLFSAYVTRTLAHGFDSNWPSCGDGALSEGDEQSIDCFSDSVFSVGQYLWLHAASKELP